MLGRIEPLEAHSPAARPAGVHLRQRVDPARRRLGVVRGGGTNLQEDIADVLLVEPGDGRIEDVQPQCEQAGKLPVPFRVLCAWRASRSPSFEAVANAASSRSRYSASASRVAILVVPELRSCIAASAASFRARSSPSIVLRIRASSSRRKRAARSSACSLSASERRSRAAAVSAPASPFGVLRSVGVDELTSRPPAPALTSRN